MNGQIVVGWSDSPEGRSAREWAAAQAAATDRCLVVLDEVPQDSLGGGAGDQNEHQLIERTRTRLAAAVEILADRFVGLEVRVVVEVDDRAAGLVRWSSVADILVLGAPPRRHLRMMGSLTDHLAAAAHSPVALIPGGWQAGPDATGAVRGGAVVVGATTTMSGRAAVHFASQEAVRLDATLLAVVGAERRSAEGRSLVAHFADLAAAEPGLMIEVHWAGGDPAQALVDLARDARLVVIGVHHSEDRWSIRLGPVTETVLSRVACPVITVARLHTPAAGEPAAPAWLRV
ncbi:nucleotide-binding universal stress UspA family protein [Nakamurella sp. UYEF19]|uniref:universal stress protein n=1 Tax=Nakamurella sp. UYEF19 TaxID=1756392 RepID=UPI003394E5CC